jgi:hypothetical protein
VSDDLVIEQLKAIRKDIAGLATKEDLGLLATKDDLDGVRRDLEGLRTELLRHFVEVETRIATEVHELIALLRSSSPHAIDWPPVYPSSRATSSS